MTDEELKKWEQKLILTLISPEVWEVFHEMKAEIQRLHKQLDGQLEIQTELKNENYRLKIELDWFNEHLKEIEEEFKKDWTYEMGTGEVVEEIIQKLKSRKS